MNTRNKRLLSVILSLCLLLGACLLTACTGDTQTNELPERGFMVEAEIGEGQTIYDPGDAAWGYRYGPSMLYNEDGVLEGWFSGPPDYSGTWDVLFYRYSTDYGKTWSEEVVGVEPIKGSREEYSCCDPGFIKMDGYYYALYTSTIESQGRYNDVYGARSTSPVGPWEKWNGSSWGGDDPQPMVMYGSDVEHYGIGEPSAVVVNGKIYLYYTYKGRLGNGQVVNQTRVAIGDATDPNWPATLKEAGVCVGGKNSEEDSLDVKYIPDYKLWVGVTTCKRFSKQSYIQIYQSFDGVTFYEAYQVNDDLAQPRLHNIGMTGDGLGHIDLSIPQFVCYAYAKTGLDWGRWSTEINQINWKITEIKNLREVMGETVSVEPGFENDINPKIWAMTESSESRSASRANDGNPDTFYSSLMHTGITSSSNRYHSGKYYAESLAMTAWEGYASGITLTPRADLYCFPEAFTLQYSQDGVIWTDIPGQQYSDYRIEDAQPITFSFGRRVTAFYFRILATELSADQFGSYALQIAEMSLNL